jgi:carbon monoxide dehydrogenase subunit G
MLHFEGDKEFRRPPEEVWARLSDARFLVQCIPDAQIVGQPEADKAVCKLRPGFAFIRGTLEVTIKVVEAVSPGSVRLSLFSKAIGASSEVEAVVTLAGKDSGTQAHWTADVKTLGGLLKLVPGGLIKGAAQNVINDVWTRVDAKMAG